MALLFSPSDAAQLGFQCVPFQPETTGLEVPLARLRGLCCLAGACGYPNAGARGCIAWGCFPLPARLRNRARHLVVNCDLQKPQRLLGARVLAPRCV